MICSYCSAAMPEVSGFCPGCGRAVTSNQELGPGAPDVAPLSRESFLGAVAYVAVVPAMVLLVVPALKRRHFARFHAWQSLLFAGGTIVVGIVTKLLFAALSLFPFFGFLLAWLLAGVVALAIVFLWIAMVTKAALGEAYQLPWLGHWAASLANR